MEDVVVRGRFGRRRAVDPQELVVATVAEHAESLLRVARRHTACQDDAEDAYQRALEIFVKQAHRLDPQTAHKWLHTVVKREAWAVGEARGKLVGVADDEALDALDDGRCVPSIEERSERFEELTRAAEALGRLKPQEVTALVLKAQGLSYAEIAEREGWTYTKVNRCLTEGRRSFLQRFAGIETGAECERWMPSLSAIADGEATAEQLLEARPHLRNCPACRSALGEMHRGQAAAAALLPPVALGGGAGGLFDRLADVVMQLHERVAAPVIKVQSSLEAAGSMKVAAVAASTVALAGGGVAVRQHGTIHVDARPAEAAASAERTPGTAAASAAPAAGTRTIATAPDHVAHVAPPPAAEAHAERRAPRRDEPHAATGASRAVRTVDAEFAPESARQNTQPPAAVPAPASAPQPAARPAAQPRSQPATPTSEPSGEFDLGG